MPLFFFNLIIVGEEVVGSGVVVSGHIVVIVGVTSSVGERVSGGIGVSSGEGLDNLAFLDQLEGLFEISLSLGDILSISEILRGDDTFSEDGVESGLGLGNFVGVIHVQGGALDRGEFGMLSLLGGFESFHEHIFGLFDFSSVLDGNSDSRGNESSDSNLKDIDI